MMERGCRCIAGGLSEIVALVEAAVSTDAVKDMSYGLLAQRTVHADPCPLTDAFKAKGVQTLASQGFVQEAFQANRTAIHFE
jgi:predicted Rossmann fold nucleotide-binding protein DprA/Smf involved in DNA uptake